MNDSTTKPRVSLQQLLREAVERIDSDPALRRQRLEMLVVAKLTEKLPEGVKFMIARMIDAKMTRDQIVEAAKGCEGWVQTAVGAYADDLIQQRMTETDR